MLSFGFSLKGKKNPVNRGSGSCEDNMTHIPCFLFFQSLYINITDNSVKACLIFWQGDMYIKNLQIYLWCTHIICHTVPHNWNELDSSHEARKILTLGSTLDLLYSVRGYRNISFKDKVILNKNQKIHSEFITASDSYISQHCSEFSITQFKQNLYSWEK